MTTIRKGEAELWYNKLGYVHKEGFSDGKMNLLFDFCCWFIVDQREVGISSFFWVKKVTMT